MDEKKQASIWKNKHSSSFSSIHIFNKKAFDSFWSEKQKWYGFLFLPSIPFPKRTAGGAVPLQFVFEEEGMLSRHKKTKNYQGNINKFQQIIFIS